MSTFLITIVSTMDSDNIVDTGALAEELVHGDKELTMYGGATIMAQKPSQVGELCRVLAKLWASFEVQSEDWD